MKKKSKKNTLLILFSALLIPMVLFTLVIMSKHVYPFGGSSLLRDDMNYQYINYFSYYKTHFGHISDFLYSYNMTLGGNFFGLTAYYLLSPFNLILLLFPVTKFPFAIYLMTMLKIGFAGFNMFLFLKFQQKKFILHTIQIKDNIGILLFSTAYGLMSYNMVYSLNIMWLDVTMLLPLVILGIEWQLNKQSSWLYTVTLFLSLIFNYYIGFMVCLFSGTYFLFRFIQKKFIDKAHINYYLMWLRYVLSSLLAVGISCIILLPTLSALKGVKNTSAYHFTWDPTFNALDFIMKLFGGTFRYTELFVGPNIYAGMLILFLAIFYFLNKKIKLPERLLSLALIIFLFFNSYISGINLIWHGFSAPQGYPNRWSFIFSFLLIMLAYRQFITSKIDKNSALKLFGLVFLLSTLFAKLYPTLFTTKTVLYNILICALLLVVYTSEQLQKKKSWIWLLLALSFIDLSFNARAIFSGNYPDISYTAFKQYTKTVQPVIEKIKKYDTGFYRIGTTFQRTEDDPMLFNYNGVSHYSSSETAKNIQFANYLGYLQSTRWTNYNNGSTLAADSLLGIKYIVTPRNTSNDQTTINNGGLAHSKISTQTASQFIFSMNDYRIYQNRLSLNLGSVVSNNSLNYNFAQHINQNVFNRQNKLYSSLLAKPTNILTTAQFQSRQQTDQQLTYHFKTNSSGKTYLFLPLRTDVGPQSIKVTVNGKIFNNILSDEENGIMSIGHYNSGINLKVTVNSTDPNILAQIKQPQIATENYSMLKSAITEVKSIKVKLHHQSNTSIKGTITNNENNKVLLLTLPYDKGWYAKINGKTVNTKQALGNLLAVPLTKGQQTLELHFIPKHLYLGIMISSITFVLAITFVLIEFRFLKRITH